MRLGAGDSQRRSAHTLAAAELHSAHRWRSSQLPLGAPGQVPARRRRRSPRLPHALPATGRQRGPQRLRRSAATVAEEACKIPAGQGNMH